MKATGWNKRKFGEKVAPLPVFPPHLPINCVLPLLNAATLEERVRVLEIVSGLLPKNKYDLWTALGFAGTPPNEMKTGEIIWLFRRVLEAGG
jgi:hypothetical protein